MGETQEKNTRKSPVSMKKSVVRGIVPAAAVAVIVLVLFGKIGKNWVIGALAAACCFIGVFLCTFGWGYLKAVENYYKANPELMQKEDGPGTPVGAEAQADETSAPEGSGTEP